MRAFALAAMLAICGAAAADEPERPWAAGVAPDKQTAAFAKFNEGNEAFAKDDFATAAARYRDALADWSHPAIRGNLAIALIHLDRPIEAYEQLELAFAFGAAPFEPTVYAQLQTNYKLLRGQLARIAITGDTAGARVLLDGAELARGRHVIRAGEHELVARRAGYLTFTSRVVAAADQDLDVAVHLVPLAEASRLERRWAAWKPWAVTAGGAVVALAGVGFELAAQSNVDDYELEIARECPSGCEPSSLPDAVNGLQRRARLQNTLGVATLIAGGAAIAVGLGLVVVNQPRRRSVDEAGRVVIVPAELPGGAGIAALGRF